MNTAEKRYVAATILEPAIRDVEKKLQAAGFCVEGAILLTIVVPKDESEFNVLEWRLYQEGQANMVDAMTLDALDRYPTARVDAERRGAPWPPLKPVRPAPTLHLSGQLLPRLPKRRHPILQWFCAWLRPKP